MYFVRYITVMQLAPRLVQFVLVEKMPFDLDLCCLREFYFEANGFSVLDNFVYDFGLQVKVFY